MRVCVRGNAVRQGARSYLEVVTADYRVSRMAVGARGVKRAAMYKVQVVKDVRPRASTASCPAGRVR